MTNNEISRFEFEKIEIYYLKRIWYFSKLKHQRREGDGFMKDEWNYLIAVFNTLGIGLEPTLNFLFTQNPSFSEFENWILTNGLVESELISHFNSVVKATINNEIDFTLNPILSEKDLKNWDENGYVIIKQAISKDQCEKTRALIYNHIGASECDSNTWYQDHPSKQGIMVQLFNNKVLNENRLSEKIKLAYYQLWKRNDLLVSMDRVSFNPPETDTYHFPGPNLHWDVSLKRPIPFGLQGLLYLTNTTAEQGAFTLVPGFHNKIDQWLEELPEHVSPRDYDFEKLKPKPIAGEAGDFIIWHQSLPHGSSPNRTKMPRIVQYINYQPIDFEMQNEWI